MVNGDLGQVGERAVTLVGKVELKQKVEFVTIHHLNMEETNVILSIQRRLQAELSVQQILVLKV